MKIQAPKSPFDRNYPSTDDALNQEEANPGDFFAEMMMGLMLQPSMTLDAQQVLATDDAQSPVREGEPTPSPLESISTSKRASYSTFVELALQSSKQSTSMQTQAETKPVRNLEINGKMTDATSEAMQNVIPAKLTSWLAEQTMRYQPVNEQASPAEKIADDINQLIDRPIKKDPISELKRSNTLKPEMMETEEQETLSLLSLNQADTRKQTTEHDVTQIFAKDASVKTVANDNNPYTQALTTLGHMIQEQTAPIGKPVLSEKFSEADFSHIKQTVSQTAELAEAPVKIDIAGTLEPLKKEAYTANIKIYPPELGSVIAKLKITKNTAELTLTTENDRVKQVVEANLPALRDHFIRSDLNLTSVEVRVELANTDVSDQQLKQQADQQKSENGVVDEGIKQNTKKQELIKKRLNSLVDTYV